jgi:hypothetical protein
MPAPQRICACRRDAASSVIPVPEKRIGSSLHHASTRAPGWVLPSLGLVLVPKCPVCIAAWLALGGSFGISLTTATYLRTGFVWICWGVLALMAVRLVIWSVPRMRSVFPGR